MTKDKLFYPIIIVLLLFCGFTASAQERTITGLVIGADDEMPIPMANVVIKDKPGTGTATDFDGNFTIQAAPGDVMVVSAIGLGTKQIAVDQRTEYTISLETDIAELGTVVITGFDNVEERLFTGANSTIKAEELKVDGVVDVSRMLEGKAAGVSVQNVTGTFGAAPKITIRGSSSIFGDNKPLFVIDGVVQEDIVNLDFDELTSGNANTLIGSSIAGLNANDIENIEILKDASATALYGARALNGVVVINTKSGGVDRPTTVNYTLEQTVRDIPRYNNFDILNSYETIGVLRELEQKGFLTQAGVVQGRYGGLFYSLVEDNINEYLSGGFPVFNDEPSRNAYLQQYERTNTDWFKTLFRQTMTQNHSLSFTGGGKSNAYYASLSFYDDPGWTIADEVQRITANLKNTFFISDDFNLTMMTKASVRKQKAPGTYNSEADVVSGSITRDFDINPFSYALNTNRALRPYDENGNYQYVWNNWAPFNIMEELDNNQLDLNMQDILFQVQTDWDFAKNFNYGLTASGRFVNNTTEHNIYENSNVIRAYRSDETTIIQDANIFLYTDPENPTARPVVALPEGGIYTRTDNYLESYYLRNIVSYKNKINNIHDVNALIGQDLRYVDRIETSFTGYGMQYDKGFTVNTRPEIFEKTLNDGTQYFRKSIEKERTISFFSKATYAYDNRYVFSATGRYDGSNRQGQTSESRWLPTGSVSAKWNISNEKFMENSTFINNLQFRPAYGLTATAGPVSNSTAIFLNTITDRFSVDDRENGLDIDELANSDLTWEKQNEINLGLDIGLLSNKIQFSVDAYQRDGFDLIDYVRTTGVGGQYIKLGNNADMTTKGIEMSLSTTNIKTDNFSWNSIINFSTFDQEITTLQDTPNVLDLVDQTGGNVVGFPRNSLFAFDFKGLNEQGLPTFNLPEGENEVTGANFQATENILDYLVYQGPTEPNTTIGFSNTLNYKNWSMNFFVIATWGNKIRLNPMYNDDYSDLDVFTQDFTNRWLVPGDENITNIPVIPSRRLLTENTNMDVAYNAYNYSTARVADGGFVRLKNISLSYNFPNELIDRLGLSSFSLRALTTNPLLLYSDDKLNGQDPEFFQSGGVAYPITRQYTLTLMLSI